MEMYKEAIRDNIKVLDDSRGADYYLSEWDVEDITRLAFIEGFRACINMPHSKMEDIKFHNDMIKEKNKLIKRLINEK